MSAAKPGRLARTTLVVALGLLLIPALQPPRADAADLSPTGAASLEALSSCLQSRPLLAVAIVIDESASLLTTDREDRRAAILGQFIRRLADLSRGDVNGRAREVHLNIGFFGTDYAEWRAWRPIDPDRVEDIASEAARETAERDGGADTRYSQAIDPARVAIEDITARLGSQDLCTMVVWFSDGELDPDPGVSGPPDRPAVQEATRELCDPGGLLDRFRATGATLVGIMLDSTSIDRSGAPLPRKQEMVEGSGPNGPDCGTEAARGLYLEGELDVLGRLFERVAAESQGGTLLGQFDGESILFPVDAGVERVRIVGPASDGFDLRTAGGRDLSAAPSEPASGSLAGLADVEWTDDIASVDVPVGDDVGMWTLERIGQRGTVDVYYFADLTIEPDTQASRLARGTPSVLVGRVTTIAGGAVDASLFERKSLTIDVGQGPVAVDIEPDGSFRQELEVETEEAVLPVVFELQVVTSGGVALQPIVREVRLEVTLPEEFPRVEVADVARPRLKSPGDEGVVTLRAVGSPVGATRVCVSPGETDPAASGTDGAALVAVTTEPGGTCVELEAGEERDVSVPVRLVDASLTARDLEVPLSATLTSAAVEGRGSAELAKTLRPTVEVLPADPDRTTQWLLLALGLLVPLAALMVANHRAARFSTRSLQVARVPVLLQPGAAGAPIVRVDGSTAGLLHDDDFAYLPPTVDGSRTYVVGPGRIRTRTPLNPFGSVRAEVVADGDALRLVSNVHPAICADGGHAGFRLVPQGAAYLAITDSALRSAAEEGDGDIAPVPAELVAFLSPSVSGDSDALADVVRGLQDGLIDAERLRALRNMVPIERGPEPDPTVADPDEGAWGSAATSRGSVDPWDPRKTSGRSDAPGSTPTAPGDPWQGPSSGSTRSEPGSAPIAPDDPW